MPSILFVCTANRFRSPLAALFFARQVVGHGNDADFRVMSAGTWATQGQPAMSDALQLAKEKNLNLGYHKSRMVSEAILLRTDLILVMETGHKEGIQNDFPEAADRIFLLTEAVGEPPVDIPDPYMDGVPADAVAKEIFSLIEAGYEKIIDLAWKMVEKKK